MGTLLLSFIFFLIFYINHRFFLATEILEFRTFLSSYLHDLLFSGCLSAGRRGRRHLGHGWMEWCEAPLQVIM
jgi:hypothetical protein